MDLFAVEKGECGAVSEVGTHLLHQVQGKGWTTGSIAVEEPALGVEAAGFKGGAAVVHEEAVEEGEEGIDGVAWRAAGAACEGEGVVVVGEEVWEGAEVGGGGIALDTAKGVEGGGVRGQADAGFEKVGRADQFEGAGGVLVAVVTRSTKEDVTGVGEFGGHHVFRDGKAWGIIVGGAVLGAAEQDVSGCESVGAGEEFAVGRVEGKGDMGFGTGCHKGGAGGDVVAKADDAIEVEQGDPEFGVAVLADFHGFTVFAQVGFLKGDEQGVEMGLQGAIVLSSCFSTHAAADFLVRGWQMGSREQAEHLDFS